MCKEVIIRTEGLTKKYGDMTAVNNLNLEIYRGEVFGLLGPNGAGKTTTTLMLLGLTEPSSGHAYINGFDCTRDTIKVKRNVGYLPDNVGFYPDLTGRENLRFTGRINGLTDEEIEERSTALLEKVGMTYAADKKAGTYSRGMRQRLGIADALMKDPDIIIMDEPTLGLDPEGMRELIELIRQLAVEDGRTILLSSHQLYQVQKICDRMGIFVGGSLIASGRLDELMGQVEGEELFSVDIQLESADERAAKLFARIPGVRSSVAEANGAFHIEAARDVRMDLLAKVAEEGYSLLQLRYSGGDLDEIYRRYFEKAGETDEKPEDDKLSGAVPKGIMRLFRK